MEVVQKKFFPQADNWMWDYCQYLGSIHDTDGRPYDLGIWISDDKREISFALVDGQEPGSYHSGNIYFNEMIQAHAIRWLQTDELLPHRVAFKLAQEAGAFDAVLHKIDLDNIQNYYTDIYRFLSKVPKEKHCIAVLKTGEEIDVICSRTMKPDFPLNVSVHDSETYNEICTSLIHYFIDKV